MHLPKKRIVITLSTASSATVIRRNGLLSIGCVLLAILIAWPCEFASAVRAPNTTIVNKCCRVGEQLDKEQRCLVGGTEKWWPHIYLIVKRTYYQVPGEAPRFLKFREHEQPTCDNRELFTGSTTMAVFSNGSLYLLERNLFIEPDSYCVDKDAAIVCLPKPQGADSLTAPIQTTKIRKCCGLQSVYNTKAATCVSLDDGHELFSKKLIMNSTAAIDFVFGFPVCKSTAHTFTIAGQFREEHMEMETGSLTLDSGRQILSNEYCLEHTVTDMNSTYVNVFQCADQFVAPKTAAPVKVSPRFVLLYAFLGTLLRPGHANICLTLIFSHFYSAGRSLSYLRHRSTNLCHIFVRHIGHRISIAIHSSCAALALSNILRCLFAGGRFTFSHHSNLWWRHKWQSLHNHR